MLVLDVNVLVAAHHRESPPHEPIRQWLMQQIADARPIGIPEIALMGLIRITTRTGLWKIPATLTEAFSFCDALLASPTCMTLQPSERQWPVFEDLCRKTGAQGNLITDAYMAAFAIDRDATLVTLDQDFARFPGLSWRSPLEKRARTNPK